MTYTVVWMGGTVDALAEIWLSAADQAAVTDASARVERALKDNPFAVGRRRNASVNRLLIEPPLGVDYEIIEDDKKVRTLRVWAAP